MCELFHEVPEAIRSTLEVADKIDDFDIRPKQAFMPHFPLPAGVSSLEEYLKALTTTGLAKRYGDPSAEVSARAEFELGVINSMGYAGYFLITHDFIRAARELGIMVGPGSGSAAGSIVSYALGITNVDPLHHGLLFERFLNPTASACPTSTSIFRRPREEVIGYARRNTGGIGLPDCHAARTSRAVLGMGRVLGIR